jgi:hypothetical protein
VLDSAADKLLPDGAQVQQTLEFLNKALKAEVLIDNFHNVLFWTSFLEVVLLMLIVLFFLRAPTQMYFALCHLPHIPRAFFGLQLNDYMPRTGQMLDLIKPSDKGNEAEALKQ